MSLFAQLQQRAAAGQGAILGEAHHAPHMRLAHRKTALQAVLRILGDDDTTP